MLESLSTHVQATSKEFHHKTALGLEDFDSLSKLSTPKPPMKSQKLELNSQALGQKSTPVKATPVVEPHKAQQHTPNLKKDSPSTNLDESIWKLLALHNTMAEGV